MTTAEQAGEAKRPARPKRPARSEICQIKWSVVQRKAFAGNSYQFWGEALGPKGFYNAGSSPVFQGGIARHKTSPNAYYQEYLQSTPGALQAFNALAERLWADGWQPISFGARFWHDVKYRRPVRRVRGSTSQAPDVAAQTTAAVAKPVAVAKPFAATAEPPARRPDWYADPSNRFPRRYWNGTAWTEHVMTTRGKATTDPLKVDGI